ncbi:hypothetical protein GCM10029964_045390 [Kibdelosporangium lantanae]
MLLRVTTRLLWVAAARLLAVPRLLAVTGLVAVSTRLLRRLGHYVLLAVAIVYMSRFPGVRPERRWTSTRRTVAGKRFRATPGWSIEARRAGFLDIDAPISTSG